MVKQNDASNAKEIQDVLLTQSHDRRLLDRVPLPDAGRKNTDRRKTATASKGDGFAAYETEMYLGLRYAVDYPVLIMDLSRKVQSTNSKYFKLSSYNIC